MVKMRYAMQVIIIMLLFFKFSGNIISTVYTVLLFFKSLKGKLSFFAELWNCKKIIYIL